MTEQTLSTPVLVVGAGPVGAVVALELARHGVECIVIERSLRPSPHPKMDYINGRSMEHFRRLGLADAIRDSGVGAQYPTDFAWTLGFDQPPILTWHHPSVAEMRQRYAEVNDGSAPVEAYQRVQGSILEGLLRAEVRDHPKIDLREGWTLSDLREEPDGVTAMVVDPTTKSRRAIRAGYLVAGDGARSTVRRCLDIGLDERGDPTQHCSVYFASRDRNLRRHGRAFVTIAAKGLTLVSRDENRAWTASFAIPRGEPLTRDPMEVVQERLGLSFSVDDVMSVAHWDGSLAVAESYGTGRVFLAGDAAHQFYPAGGHGANTGIGDAVDLAWKLAAAVHGWGGPALMASYDAERRPVALLNRELCATLVEVWRRFGRMAETGAPKQLLAGLLEEDAHQIDNLGVHFGYRYSTSPIVWHETAEPPPWHWRTISATTWPGGRAPALRLADGSQLFDQFGPGLTLVDFSPHRIGEPLVRKAQGRGIPMIHLPIADANARACWERDLVLVRPDDHVAWRDNHAPDDWDAVLDHVTGHENP